MLRSVLQRRAEELASLVECEAANLSGVCGGTYGRTRCWLLHLCQGRGSYDSSWVNSVRARASLDAIMVVWLICIVRTMYSTMPGVFHGSGFALRSTERNKELFYPYCPANGP